MKKNRTSQELFLIADKKPDYKVEGKVKLTTRNGGISKLFSMGVDKLDELKKDVKKKYGSLTKPYRQVHPTPTIDDYFISTKAAFDVVDDTDNAQDTWREMVDSGKYEHYRSDIFSTFSNKTSTGHIISPRCMVTSAAISPQRVISTQRGLSHNA